MTQLFFKKKSITKIVKCIEMKVNDFELRRLFNQQNIDTKWIQNNIETSFPFSFEKYTFF